MNYRNIARSAIAGLLTLNVTGCSDYVAAVKKENALSSGYTDTCYGIAKSGGNDCKTAANVCVGWSGEDRDPSAFIYLPNGTC